MQIKSTPLIFTVFGLFLFYCSSAQQQPAVKQFSATSIIGLKNEIRLQQFSTYASLRLPSAEIAAFCKSNTGKTNMRLSLTKDIAFDLELERSTIISPDYKLYIKTDTGTEVINARPDFLYKGKTKEGGAVRLAIKDGFISGSIRDGEKEYFIEPMKRFYENAGADEFIVYQPADVIDSLFGCGYNDAEHSAANASQEREYGPLSVQENICHKIRFAIVADNSMYEKFNHDVDALEANLLAALNAAEGFYTGFEFDKTLPADEGSDMIKFEAVQMVVSTCKACDPVKTPTRLALVFPDLSSWIKQNIKPTGLQINQYWTTYDLNAGTIIGYAQSETYQGCGDIITQIHHYNDGIAVLRIQVAHETGHNLGCAHDNNIKSSVNSFIMNSGLRIDATRFSRLSDFGGIHYSSNLAIRDTIQIYNACEASCEAPICNPVSGLKMDSTFRGDGLKFVWNGTGQYVVQYKQQQAAAFDPANIKLVSGNSIVLSNLNPCAGYFLEVKNKCSDSTSSSVSMDFSPWFYNITEKPVNLRGELYDLQIEIEKITDKDKDAYCKIGHLGPFLKVPAAQNSIIIGDLFADGARHRIDFLLDTTSSVCKKIIYYQAPYYRADSKKLLNIDFNDCTFPGQLTDSIFTATPAGYIDPPIVIRDFSFATVILIPGTIDNSCMLFYDNYGKKVYNGNFGLYTVPFDLTGVRDPYLSFDYKYLAYANTSKAGYVPTYLKVMAFNGTVWQEIFRRQNDEEIGTRLFRNIWDTLPPRAFIPLEKYSNKQFQLQFVIDDRTRAGILNSSFFAAIDNILVDGYDTSATTSGPPAYTLFPNPSRDILFIKGLPAGQTFFYTITDVLGRVMKKEMLVNYQVDISHFPAGIYFCNIFQEGKKILSPTKFVKH